MSYSMPYGGAAASSRFRKPTVGTNTIRAPQMSQVQGTLQGMAGAGQTAQSRYASTGVSAPGSYGQTGAYSAAPATSGYQAGTTKPYTQQQQTQAQYQRELMGPELSNVLMGQNQGPLTQRGLQFQEQRLAYETQQKSEADRQRAYEELARSWSGVGQSPEAMAASRSAMGMLSSGGPYSTDVLEKMRGNLGNQAGLSYNRAADRAAEDYAMRGISGGMSDYEQAGLRQQSAAGLQTQLSDLAQTAATSNWQARQQATQDLQGISSQQEAQRTALDQMIAELFSGTERTAPDLSGWSIPQKNKQAKRSVGW